MDQLDQKELILYKVQISVGNTSIEIFFKSIEGKAGSGCCGSAACGGLCSCGLGCCGGKKYKPVSGASSISDISHGAHQTTLQVHKEWHPINNEYFCINMGKIFKLCQKGDNQ